MLDKRTAAVALVAVFAAVMPVAQAATYTLQQLNELYGGQYGRYLDSAYYGQYRDVVSNITVDPQNSTVINQLQRALNGSMPAFAFAPIATALLVILALAQLFV